LIDVIFERFHGIYEGTIFNGHKQINRVEIFLAIKASCQVGFRIGSGVKVETLRTLKTEYLVRVSHLEIQQIFDYPIDWDCVTKHF
jgi:hypothetical protein